MEKGRTHYLVRESDGVELPYNSFLAGQPGFKTVDAGAQPTDAPVADPPVADPPVAEGNKKVKKEA